MSPYWDSNADHQLVAVSLYPLHCLSPFYPDAGSNTFLRNLCTCPPNYTASHPGRPVLLLTAVRTANLSVKCRRVIKLIEMLQAFKDAETR